MVRGNKNDSVLYLKGPQGIGKSTLSEFFQNYVILFHTETKIGFK